LIALPEFGAAVDFASIAEGVAEGEAWIKRTEKFERISAGIAKAEIGRVRMVGAVMLDEGSMQGELDELLKSPTPRFIRNVPMSGSGESRGLELVRSCRSGSTTITSPFLQASWYNPKSYRYDSTDHPSQVSSKHGGTAAGEVLCILQYGRDEEAVAVIEVPS